ncbi:MAG: acyl-CoA reductase [Cyclobacteriaceae bacterium]
MKLQERIDGFVALGERIDALSDSEKTELSRRASNENAWFTEAHVSLALLGLQMFLDPSKISDWINKYHLRDQGKSVGLVMAGNIPMVGFHDLFCVLMSGNKLMAKLSSSDSVLIRQLIDWLVEINGGFASNITIADRLNDAEAIIATGSDNTARYFRYYFDKKPHIIRQNRTSVAVLTGDESKEDITNLGSDIFSYYGLGCRNVSKIYIPKGFDLCSFLDVLSDSIYKKIAEHHKYCNNYDYNKSIYLVNGDAHLDTGFLLLKEEIEQLVSPISVLYYAYYDSPQQLLLTLAGQQDKIQCTVGDVDWLDGLVPFGQTQCPQLSDYADGVDTMEFLSNLK